ncbi:MAG: sulfatase-like hydrolase/transferase, partial [Propionicimonas sp.]|nr:sulfatase-like hydrolase/transferase [Propionicimonas sp.]
MTTPSSARPSRASRVAFWSLLTLALILASTAIWIRQRFGAVTFEQILSTLPVGNGAGVGNNDLAVEAAVWCIGLPICLVGAAALLWLRWRRPVRRTVLLVPATAFAIALGALLMVAGVPQYAAAYLDPRTVADYYVTPEPLGRPGRPLNLITIYLESTENTYADAGLFGENLIAAQQQATAGWAGYESLRQDPVGGWTMAGLVATQCAIPLKSVLVTGDPHSNSAGETVERYLPGATCLGDVLEAEGYTNTFLGGAHARFAGKDTFLTDHGYTTIRGREEWELSEDPSELSVWGLSDARLFEHAKQTLAGLRAAGSPFHLTMLTLDTHEPGAVYGSCDARAQTPIATALKCSGAALAGFLDHLGQAGYLDDTVVVVMGDHLKNLGDSDQLRDQLASAPERTVFFRVHSPNPVSFARQDADQLSVLPTILDVLGFDLPDGRAGLGVSFASPHPLEGTLLALPEPDYTSLLRAPSRELYQGFWR